MKTSKLTAQFREVVQSNHSLSSYLRGLNEGRQATPHSWLYEHEDMQKALDRWVRIMREANLRRSPFGREFNQFDEAQLVKVGPQGEIPPISSPAAQEVIEPIFSPSDWDDEMKLSEYFQYTREFAKYCFGDRLCTDRPLSLGATILNMADRDTLNTNSGWPRFGRRSKFTQEEIEDAQTGRAYDFPAIVLFREYYGKLRPVWMYPMAMNLLELRFEQPLKDKLRSSQSETVRQWCSPWSGYETTKSTLTAQWKSGGPIRGGDTTKMDAHMRRAQLRLFYECVKWLFQERYWPELYHCIMRVTEIPLIVGIDAMLTGFHGLASGSGWTQTSETVLVMFICWLHKHLEGQGEGDDFYIKSGITAEDLVSMLASFGLPAKPEKQTVSSTYLHFLQRMNRVGFFSREDPSILGGYYPTIRAWESSMWPEKFHRPKLWSKDMFARRQFSIAENTIDDPCFPEFVEYVVEGHPYLQEFAKKSASELAAIDKDARRIPGLNPTYNQEKRDKPMSEYASIKLAKTL